MSNVTVQEALKKSLARFQMIDAGQIIFVRDAIDDCKAALAKMEKCEPVYQCLICANGNDLPEGEYCRACGRENNMTNLGRAIKFARGGNAVPNAPLIFTSPQPIECEDWQYFDKAYKKAAETSDATDWMNAALLAQQVRRKQLNTKG